MAEDRHSGVPGGGGGSDVKSGVETSITVNETRSVTFGTAFASTPNVTAQYGGTGNADDRMTIVIANVSTTGFDMILRGNPSTVITDLQWIATDAGN